MLRKLSHDPVLLNGGTGAKERTAALSRLTAEPGGQPLLAVATGSYVGGGLRLPRSQHPVPRGTYLKGKLAQYAGRVLRPCEGKTSAEIHDYHDELTPVLASSLTKSAPGYKPWLP
jgi:superfamily II DNA or RNA helicase